MAKSEIDNHLENLNFLVIPSVQLVLTRQGQKGLEVFLGLRKTGSFVNQWSFPGGKVDEGESDEFSACREALEETGIEIHEKDLNFMFDTESTTVRERDGILAQIKFQIKVFKIEAQNLNPINASPNEHSEMRWFPLEEALSIHSFAIVEEQKSGVPRPPDQIPGVLAPQTLKTVQYLMKGNKS